MWKKPYKKGDFPVELDGKKHDCPNRQRGGDSYDSKYGFDMWAEPTKPRDKYEYCGKCGKQCETITKQDEHQVYKEEWRNLIYIGAYCHECEMFPNTTHDGDKDGTVKPFMPNPDVKAIMNNNIFDIEQEYRGKVSDAPTNWICMNNDGTMKAGYKITGELTDWYEKEGKEILKEMRSKIWHKKKELN